MTESSSIFIIISGSRLHFPFLKFRQSNFRRTLPVDPLPLLPLLPPQKKILVSFHFTQAANPVLALGTLKGSNLNLLCLKLYSSISAVLCPSAYSPPKIKILVLEMGTADNLVFALLMDAISFQMLR